MDLLFLEHLEFRLPLVLFAHCRIASSQEEVLRNALASAGLELIDYGSWTDRILAKSGYVLVSAYSRAYRERAERATVTH